MITDLAIRYPDFLAYGNAACRDPDVDPELFFPSGDNQGRVPLSAELPAKQVCSRCELRSRCAEWATENYVEYGIWGALSPAQREGRRRRAALA